MNASDFLTLIISGIAISVAFMEHILDVKWGTDLLPSFNVLLYLRSSFF